MTNKALDAHAGSTAREIVSTRLISATEEEIFRAFADPELLAEWWGPRGFTNTFEAFDFREGGEWKFVMHSPEGQDYPNHCRFEVIQAPARIVIRHDSAPGFTLTTTLTHEGGKTRIEWNQCFDTAELRDQLATVCIPANEQNFDRLEAVLASAR